MLFEKNENKQFIEWKKKNDLILQNIKKFFKSCRFLLFQLHKEMIFYLL